MPTKTIRRSRPLAQAEFQDHWPGDLLKTMIKTQKISNDEIIRDHGNQDVMPLQAPTRL
jgi:hypothetical protein